jgi:hypothetical protein
MSQVQACGEGACSLATDFVEAQSVVPAAMTLRR